MGRDYVWVMLRHTLIPLSLAVFFRVCATRCKPCWCKRWQGLLTEAEHACITVWSAQLISCESRLKDEGLCYQFNSLGLFVPAFANQLILYLAPLIKLRLCSALCKGSNNLDSSLYLSRSDSICALCVCVQIHYTFLNISMSSRYTTWTVILTYLLSVTQRRGCRALIYKLPQSIISPHEL